MPRQPAHDLWALLLARIYAAFPLLGPRGGGELRISAFITAALMVQKILTQVGEPTSAPPLAKGSRTTAVGDAGRRDGRDRLPGPARTGLPVRSARRVVGAKARRVAARRGPTRAHGPHPGPRRPVRWLQTRSKLQFGSNSEAIHTKLVGDNHLGRSRCLTRKCYSKVVVVALSFHAVRAANHC